MELSLFSSSVVPKLAVMTITMKTPMTIALHLRQPLFLLGMLRCLLPSCRLNSRLGVIEIGGRRGFGVISFQCEWDRKR